MARTVDEIISDILTQLKVSDPAFSAEVGTPERKIIEAVADSIAQSEVDFSVLSSSLDINSLSAGSLDSFAQMLGFARQQPTAATGVVTFSRNSPATQDYVIPAGTQVQATATDPTLPDIVFITTQTVTLANGTSSVDAPVQATVPGSVGNVGANTVTSFAGLTTIVGIPNITNATPMTGGVDGEDDTSFRTRIQNSVFRNMAGTYDQFMALALTGTGTTKAITLGPISRYQEYVQVPFTDDTDQHAINYDPSGLYAHKRTTQPSTIPYSKYTYNTNFTVTDGTISATANYFKPMVDYYFNQRAEDPTSSPRKTWTSASPNQPVPGGTISPINLHQPNITIFNPYDVTTNPSGNPALAAGNIIMLEHQYLSANSRNDIPTGILNAVDVFVDGGNLITVKAQEVMPPTGNTLQQTQAGAWTYQNGSGTNLTVTDGVTTNGSPNVTSATANFGTLDVGQKISGAGIPANTIIESVVSTSEVVMNANATATATGVSITIAKPAIRNWVNGFNGAPLNATTNPARILPLFWQPVTDLPDSISVKNKNDGKTYIMYKAKYYDSLGTYGPAQTYYFDDPSVTVSPRIANYKVAIEVNGLYGTARSRNGFAFLSGKDVYKSDGVTQASIDAQDSGFIGEQFTCTYTYDSNIPTLQAVMEKNKQIGTDVLVHRATPRYFKLYLTVMYSPGATQSVVQAAINTAVGFFFQSQYFGAAIQLSDLLQVVHNVPGVDNVRWTADVLPNGSKAWTASATYSVGTYIRPSVDNGHIYKVTAASGNVGTTEPTWPTDPASVVTEGTYTYQEVAARHRIEEVSPDGTALVLPTIDGRSSPFYDYDFFLQDCQLPYSPSANQTEIRVRAQATWLQLQ